MYKPNLIENLGRYIPNPPRHAPKILPDQSLVVILETKKSITAIDVSHFFDYEMYHKDFLAGKYLCFELYAVGTFILKNCKIEDHPGGK
jgi:hypothetical protein